MIKYKKSIFALIACAIVFSVIEIKYDLFATSENIYNQIQRFMEVLQKVKQFYVEDVETSELVDGAIKGMLEQLDPHSVYISKERLQEITEQFEGKFEGIGIEFIVHNKYPTVVSPIMGSPSERLGLRPGDKIVRIEGKSTYNFTEDQVREKLLGRKGTKVTIDIQRAGIAKPFSVTITRDVIPVYSIIAAFMVDDSTGLIKLGKFARTTSEEFEQALGQLNTQGMRRLILDLRGNSGGYLEQAVKIVDKFLGSGKRIVYTIGKIPSANEFYDAKSAPADLKIPLIVLIDHGSASASEIVAGAIQDWDRGLIMGNTSFGKGLVQRQLLLKDGSAMRVTIARYYTPSGRLIQRPYNNGLNEYIAQGWDELDPNAIADSTLNKPVFTTQGGRKVYGGGGITPDIRLKSNRLTFTSIKLIQGQIFFEFGAKYAAKHKNQKNDFLEFRNHFEIDERTVEKFLQLARSKAIEIKNEEIEKDRDFIKRRIKSQIARHFWSGREFYEVELYENPHVRTALSYFSRASNMAGYVN